MKESSTIINYDKLVQQARVDSLFKPLKEEYEDNLEEIEELEFLFKNCCYNESRVIGEIDRSRSGFQPPSKEQKRNIANMFGLVKAGSKAELGVPVTVWSDMLVFEFHALLSNIVRCCNYATKFKLKNLDKAEDLRYITIGRYYNGGLDKKIKYYGQLHNFLRSQYEGWIQKVSDIRNEVIHEHIIREMWGHLIFYYERTSGDTIEAKGDVTFKFNKYKVENLEEYVEEILGKLESFIEEFFKKYDETKLTIMGLI